MVNQIHTCSFGCDGWWNTTWIASTSNPNWVRFCFALFFNVRMGGLRAGGSLVCTTCHPAVITLPLGGVRWGKPTPQALLGVGFSHGWSLWFILIAVNGCDHWYCKPGLTSVRNQTLRCSLCSYTWKVTSLKVFMPLGGVGALWSPGRPFSKALSSHMM